MLHLPDRILVPVSAYCGLHVEIDPLAADTMSKIWRIDLAFGPGEESGRMPPWAGRRSGVAGS